MDIDLLRKAQLALGACRNPLMAVRGEQARAAREALMLSTASSHTTLDRALDDLRARLAAIA
jgi:hypothetical protein